MLVFWWGRYQDSFIYNTEVKEINREDLYYWQLRGEVGPTNYNAGIIRIEMTKIDCNELEELEEEDDKADRRLLAGRICLWFIFVDIYILLVKQ